MTVGDTPVVQTEPEVPTDPIQKMLADGAKLGVRIVGVGGPPPTRQKAKILIYGATGVGKTRLSATAAYVEEWQPMLIIDPEFGVTSLESIDFGDRLHVMPCERPEEFESMRRGINSGKLLYHSVVIDGTNEFYRQKMQSVIAIAGGTLSDLDRPELQHWGQCTQWMRRVLRDYMYHTVGLECVIVVCGEQLYKDEASGMMFVGPDLPGKLAGEVGHLFDLIIHLAVKTDPDDNKRLIRVAQVQPDRRVQAKDRWDLFPPTIDAPDLAKMWGQRKEQLAKLRESRKEST